MASYDRGQRVTHIYTWRPVKWPTLSIYVRVVLSRDQTPLITVFCCWYRFVFIYSLCLTTDGPRQFDFNIKKREEYINLSD